MDIPFVKENYIISRKRGRTIGPAGSRFKFDRKIFENTIVKSRSLKYLTRTLPMPDVSVDCIIENRFTNDFHDPALFNLCWILSKELLTKHAKFSLKPDDGLGVSVQEFCRAGLQTCNCPCQKRPNSSDSPESK